MRLIGGDNDAQVLLNWLKANEEPDARETIARVIYTAAAKQKSRKYLAGLRPDD